MKSIWENDVELSSREEKTGVGTRMEKGWDLARKDIIVIGAGMTGLLTAYFLQSRGRKVTVLEAGHIAGGQTGRTTAKITGQHGLFYSKLVKNVGVEKAALYAKANQEAIAEYAKMIWRYKIPCDFERLPSYLYSMQSAEALLQEAKVAEGLGLPARFVEQVDLPFETCGAVCFDNQAQFHPLKFLKAIAGELEIYENTAVQKVRENCVYTSKGMLTANQIVFATHYPIVDVPGLYFLRQHQERSYVVALAGCDKLKGMYFSEDKDGLSLRSHGDILLVGGSSHRTGKNTDGGAYETLRAAAAKYFPEGREVAHWSAQDCMPHDELPLIGQYFYGKKDWYVATGYKKWGMTTSMIAAKLLSDMITGVENPYEKLFTPQRHLVKAACGNFLVDVGESIHGLACGWMPRHRSMEAHPDCEGARNVDGQKRQQDIVRPHPPRCSHLGCELKWNPDEETWDCPCHGSRFDETGKRLDEPTKKNLTGSSVKK